jgi:hypothetical protein
MGQSRARVILFWGGPKGRIEVIQITFKSFSRGAGRPGIVDLAGLAGAAPGESDFVLGWVGGRIEVIQISFKSYPRGTGRPGIVDSAGLAGAAPGKSDFVLGWPKGRTEVI